MVVENSFDGWRKDVFFSAAEEVQDSADIMESVYREWERKRQEGFQSDESDELSRELHTALGTTKWQLEEFERAVKLSRENGLAKNTIARHRQFVTAIEDQISRVEKALRDSLIEEGKQPLRWVQLDENERDDLAIFLSGIAGSSHDMKDSFTNIRFSKEKAQQIQGKRVAEFGVDALQRRSKLHCIKGFKEIVTINNDAKYVVELEAKEVPDSQGEMHSSRERLNEQKPALSSPEISSWRIVVADEEVVNKLQERKEIPTHGNNFCGLLRSSWSTWKLKRMCNMFGKEKEDYIWSEQALSYLNLRGMIQFTQIFRHIRRFEQPAEGSKYYILFRRSLQVTFILVLTILLVGMLLIFCITSNVNETQL